MAVDHIRYDLLAQDALRGVVRRVLTDAARNGLPGDHHFYVSFDTRQPGVRMSQRLREQYPDEMTIVLQHQFWDLAVTEHTFEVGLAFGGIPERLLVPFEAIKEFFDPSVQFGLKFDMSVAGKPQGADETLEPSPPAAEPKTRKDRKPPAKADRPRPVPTLETVRPAEEPSRVGAAKSDAVKSDAVKSDAAKTDAAKTDGPEPSPSGGGEVVRLDRFRKKK